MCNCIINEGSGYSTRSILLGLNAIQPVRLFARLIGDSELIPDVALTLTLMRDTISIKKIVTPSSF